MKTVRYRDTDGVMQEIPVAELANGEIEVTSPEVDGPCWVNVDELKPGPIRQPVFTGECADAIWYIQQSLYEVLPKTYETWEDEFRRDMNPGEQIGLWLWVTRCYLKAIRGRDVSMEVKNAYMTVLTGCLLVPRDSIVKAMPKVCISREDAEWMVGLFYETPEPWAVVWSAVEAMKQQKGRAFS